MSRYTTLLSKNATSYIVALLSMTVVPNPFVLTYPQTDK
jgi:hypothetical protein